MPNENKKIAKQLEQRLAKTKIEIPESGSDTAGGNKLRRDWKKQTGLDMKPSAARKLVRQIRKAGK